MFKYHETKPTSMTEFFISDLHLGHSNIILYESRPFKDADVMDEELIKRWNSVVSKDDLVFNLGDFSFHNKYDTSEIVSRLNGRMVLIKGNHDCHSNKWYREVGISEVVQWPVIRYGFCIFSHEPVYLQAYTPYRNVHGHVHGKQKNEPNGKFFNASVEVIDYTPVTIEYISGFLDTSDMAKKDEGEG